MARYIEKLFGTDGSVFALNAEQQQSFRNAPGHEMDDWHGHEAKMRSEYSSSALAGNMFGLPAAIKLEGTFWDCALGLRRYFHNRKPVCHFEYPLRIRGIIGYCPNLDFFIDAGDRFVGVESKYREMYSRKCGQKLQQQYFDKFEYWKEWPRLRDLANNLSDFSRLNAPQLIKHTLALVARSRETNPIGKFRLVYIYHDISDQTIAKDHERELKRFIAEAGLGGHFVARKYSAYCRQLCESADLLPQGYMDFIRQRYPLISF